MQRAYQTYPPRGPPSLPSQQNKVILQREYREKEGECFSTLRDIIKDITGEELRTRQEILRKVIDILCTAAEFKKQGSVSAQASADYGTPFPTKPEDTTMGYFTQSSPWTQSWHPGTEFDAVFAHYGAHFHDQQHFMSGMDADFNQASSSGHAEDWSLSM